MLSVKNRSGGKGSPSRDGAAGYVPAKLTAGPSGCHFSMVFCRGRWPPAKFGKEMNRVGAARGGGRCMRREGWWEQGGGEDGKGEQMGMHQQELGGRVWVQAGAS